MSERPGYRRRILIEPCAEQVSAELEDDYHRMVVTLHHAGGVITGVEAAMKRSPWTTCPGAIGTLEQTFRGLPLVEAPERTAKVQNCTHLFDLATFAAGHAMLAQAVAFEIEVSDPVDGASDARLWRNGALLLDWRFIDGKFTDPPELTGMDLHSMGGWVAGQTDPLIKEAVKILRWAAIVGKGRMIDIPAGISATKFGTGACYTFQPDPASIGTRRPGAAIDFPAVGVKPLADREELFAR